MAITVNHKFSHIPAKPVKAKPKAPLKSSLAQYRLFGKSIKPKEVIFFTSQLSLMLEIGTPLKNALEAIRNQTKNTDFKEVIHSLLRDVEEGQQLSDAMKRHPHVFSNVYNSMVKVGETGGFLHEILDRMVEMQEKRQALLTQIRSALTYPMFLCVLGFVVVVFVLVGVLPKFTAFFEGKEHILPLTTRFLMAASASLREYWWVYLIGLTACMIGLMLFKNSERGQIIIDWSFIRLPLLSRLSNKINTCSMLRTLGHLMESAVPILHALDVTCDTIKNRFFKQFIQRIQDHVQEGGNFAQPFSEYPFILDSVKQMVATGEKVGNLPEVMLRLAKFYDAEVDRELKNFATMIEPIALVVMGAVVGVIVSSVVLPLFKLAHALH
ncbi:MAG: type II secretion system F family protein [Desulfobacterales bacterium]|jgi:type II secretory pathway component PulF